MKIGIILCGFGSVKRARESLAVFDVPIFVTLSAATHR